MNVNTGSPRGFAFVTLDESVAAEAIAQTDGQEFQGRTLVVSMPLPRGEKIVRQQRARKFQKLLLVKYIYGNQCFFYLDPHFQPGLVSLAIHKFRYCYFRIQNRQQCFK